MTATIALLDAIDAMESLEAGAVYRTFTTEQSSAIFNLYIEKNFVEVIFHSNTDRAYGFNCSSEFYIWLVYSISYTDLPYSIGKMIAQGIKNGHLTPIED